jgi:hypothetical protein
MLNNKSTKAALQVTMTNGRRDVDTHTHKRRKGEKKLLSTKKLAMLYVYLCEKKNKPSVPLICRFDSCSGNVSIGKVIKNLLGRFPQLGKKVKRK